MLVAKISIAVLSFFGCMEELEIWLGFGVWEIMLLLVVLVVVLFEPSDVMLILSSWTSGMFDLSEVTPNRWRACFEA